jgi:hypothetical protein
MLNKIALVTSLFVAAVCAAAELEGVTMADSVIVDGKTLALNGQGLRKKFVFKVYVAGLYVEQKSKSGEAILAADATRRVDMKMLRALDKKAIVEAIRGGFEKNAGDTMPALKDRLDKFATMIPDVKEGETLTVVYVPGKGTSVEGAKGQSYLAEGKDFADALFSVWVGKAPVDDTLKKGMLGN